MFFGATALFHPPASEHHFLSTFFRPRRLAKLVLVSFKPPASYLRPVSVGVSVFLSPALMKECPLCHPPSGYL